MNYLAHMFLSREYPEDILGNFLADLMDISEINSLPSELQHGIRLHYFIDEFTDAHPVNKDIKRMLRPYFRKYSGVALDLYYDYFLYQNWERYADVLFSEFVQNQYRIIQMSKINIPKRLHYTVGRMISHDFLTRFTTEDGQSYAFKNLDHRAKFSTGFDQAMDVMRGHREDMDGAFNEFFPDLTQAVHRFQKSDIHE